MNAWSEVAALVPMAHLYRAFNSLGWDVLANPVVGGEQVDLFYAGAEGQTKTVVETLIGDAGLRRCGWAAPMPWTRSTACCASGSRCPVPEGAGSRSS